MSKIFYADPERIGRASAVIKVGGLVAFPTETVYGLGANAYNPHAVAGIFKAKGRPTFNPLITHIYTKDQLPDLAQPDSRATFLAEKFWPGPLTFILPRKEKKSSLDLVCAGLPNISIRCPNHPVALELIKLSNCPIAAPSANRSQSISPTTAIDVLASLEDEVDMILDGGPCSVGVESTILDLTTKNATILRAGGLTKEELEDALNEEVYLSDGNPDRPTSPGQMLKHYAPEKPFRINATSAEPDELFIAFGPDYPNERANLSPTGDLREAAANLYSFMHMADETMEYERIAVAPIPETGLGLAINDRIRRAARK